MSNNAITRSIVGRSKVTLDEVKPGLNPKFLSAQIRQILTIVSTYPTARPNAGLNDSLFNTEDFNIPPQVYESTQARVTWLNVPLNATTEMVQEQLDKLPNACIYRVVDNEPIISESQYAAIEAELPGVSVDSIAERQLLRYPDTSEYAGLPVKDQWGKLQYAVNVFSAQGHEDENLTDSSARQYIPMSLRQVAAVSASEEVSGMDVPFTQA